MAAKTKIDWAALKKAIKDRKTDKALELAEQMGELSAMQQNSLVSFVGMALNRLAGNCGEEELEKLFRERYTPVAEAWIKDTPGAKESVERFSGLMVSHGSKVTITEEPDRYVLTLDPCRSGGRLRRGTNVAGAKTSGSIKFTEKAHPFCWGKKGVSYYCIHDCVFLEMIPIDLRGYPIAVVDIADKAEDPCHLYFYKKPELIPEKYFTRLGKRKKVK